MSPVIRLKLLFLPSVDLADRAQLPRRSGIYYVVASREVVYVGRAADRDGLRGRWGGKQHHHYATLARMAKHEQVRIKYEVRPRWRIKHDEAVAIRGCSDGNVLPVLNGHKETPSWWIDLWDGMRYTAMLAGIVLFLFCSVFFGNPS